MLQNNKVLAIATRNPGKIAEFRHLFSPLGFDVRSLADYPEIPDIIEDGKTFADNAAKKAMILAGFLQLPVLADDSGLCVDALGGEPGVFSARYSDPGATDERNNLKLLGRLREAQLSGLPIVRGERGMLSKAQFVCALALHDPRSANTHRSEGVCAGFIVDTLKGTGGFGYDPLFYVPEYEKTMAELTMAEKNAISHRSKAITQMLKIIQALP